MYTNYVRVNIANGDPCGPLNQRLGLMPAKHYVMSLGTFDHCIITTAG